MKFGATEVHQRRRLVGRDDIVERREHCGSAARLGALYLFESLFQNFFIVVFSHIYQPL